LVDLKRLPTTTPPRKTDIVARGKYRGYPGTKQNQAALEAAPTCKQQSSTPRSRGMLACDNRIADTSAA